jgi:anti-sigma B factor antagonist
MTTTMTTTRPTPRRAPDRFPLYFRSNDDVTVLEISALGTEPATGDRQPIRLAVAGEIDILTAGGLRDTLIHVLHTYRPTHLSVDLADVTFMDASGVSALLRSAIAARQTNCTIAVTNPRPNVHKVLRLTGLLDEFGLATDRTRPVLTRRIGPVANARRTRTPHPAHASS